MKEEINSIKQNQTWELVNPPPGHRPITLKWVFKLKRNESGRWSSTKHDWWRADLFNKPELISTKSMHLLHAWNL